MPDEKVLFLRSYTLPPGVEAAIENEAYNMAMDMLVARHDYVPDALLDLAGEQSSQWCPAGWTVVYERYQGHIRAICRKTGRRLPKGE